MGINQNSNITQENGTTPDTRSGTLAADWGLANSRWRAARAIRKRRRGCGSPGATSAEGRSTDRGGSRDRRPLQKTGTRLRFRERFLILGFSIITNAKKRDAEASRCSVIFQSREAQPKFVFCILYSAFCIRYSVFCIRYSAFRLPRPCASLIFCRGRPLRRGRPCRPYRLRNRRWRSSARCGLRPRP